MLAVAEELLARELASTAMLVLAALRDIDPVPDEPLTALLAEVVCEPVTRRLSLRGLSAEEVGAYVELAAGEIATPALAAALHAETDGNPLFVGETIRLLELEGTGAGGKITIPQSVRDVIAQRPRHLSDEANELLVLASVLGREFAITALARVADVPEDDLLATLDEAMEARVLSDVPGSLGRLRFAHVLIRDTLYEGLTTARRVRFHRLVVEALETLDGEEASADLAYHAIVANDFEKGLRYARVAGDRALALLAFEEAGRSIRWLSTR